jgi:hypothetical protein
LEFLWESLWEAPVKFRGCAAEASRGGPTVRAKRSTSRPLSWAIPG